MQAGGYNQRIIQGKGMGASSTLIVPSLAPVKRYLKLPPTPPQTMC